MEKKERIKRAIVGLCALPILVFFLLVSIDRVREIFSGGPPRPADGDPPSLIVLGLLYLVALFLTLHSERQKRKATSPSATLPPDQ